MRLKRLYDAIEFGVADLDHPALKKKIVSLQAIRDQAKADGDHAQVLAESVGQRAITPAMVEKVARTARERPRIAVLFRNGGWGEIRTHGTLSRTAVFKTAALNRSATHP